MAAPTLSRIRQFMSESTDAADKGDNDALISLTMDILGECLGCSADEAFRRVPGDWRRRRPLASTFAELCGSKKTNGAGGAVGYSIEQHKEADAEAPFVE